MVKCHLNTYFCLIYVVTELVAVGKVFWHYLSGWNLFELHGSLEVYNHLIFVCLFLYPVSNMLALAKCTGIFDNYKIKNILWTDCPVLSCCTYLSNLQAYKHWNVKDIGAYLAYLWYLTSTGLMEHVQHNSRISGIN